MQQEYQSTRDRIFSLAERELSAFTAAVACCYGDEQGRIAAEDWIDEFLAKDKAHGSAAACFRQITVAVAARLASKLPASGMTAQTR